MCRSLMTLTVTLIAIITASGLPPARADAPNDVRVLRDVEADCPHITSERRVRNLYVGRMNRAIELAAVEAALARRAARLGFNAIHSLSIVARPRTGVQASAVAARCASGDEATGGGGKGALADIIATAESARLYELDPTDAVTAEPTISHAHKNLMRTLTTDELRAAANLALNDASYHPPSPFAPACPFAPTVGMEFVAGGKSAWWLVTLPRGSGGCGPDYVEAIMVDPQTIWRHAKRRVLTKPSVGALRDLVN